MQPNMSGIWCRSKWGHRVWDLHICALGGIFSSFFQVENNIPSVSAVTGVKPQAYIWRICIGLHSTPRFFVGVMYYNYYKNSLPFIQKNRQSLYKFLMSLCFWLYTIECSCLLAVSCISNKENYRKYLFFINVHFVGREVGR